MTQVSEKKQSIKEIVTAICGILVILLFLMILLIGYIPNRPKPIGLDVIEQRKQNLAEVTAKQAALINSYEIIDPAKNIARIPVDLAMELTVAELQSQAAQ